MVIADSLLVRLERRFRAMLPGDSFGRHVALVGGGTAFVQAIGLLVAPILTRLYEPADFGVMAAFQAVAEMAVIVATLKFDMAVPIADDDRDAAQLLVLAVLSVGTVSLLAAFAVVLLPAGVFTLISSDPRFWTWRWFLIASIGGGGLYLSVLGWTLRRRNFWLVSKSRAYQSLSSVGVQLGLGALGAGLAGLILGTFTSMVAGIGMLWKHARPDLSQLGGSSLFRGLRRIAWKYRQYPAFASWTGVLNQASRSATPIMLSALFGASVTGFFSLSQRVIGLPAALISDSVARVFLSRVGAASTSGRLGHLMEGVTRRISPLSVFVCSTVFVFGPDLFQLVFGAPWREAGLYGRLLAPWFLIAFIFGPQSTVVQAKGRQQADAGWQVLLLGGRLAAILIGTQMGSAYWAVGLFGAASFFLAGAYHLWIMRIGGTSIRTNLGIVLADLVLVGGLTAMGAAAYCLLGSPPAVMFLVIALAGLATVPRVWKAWRGETQPLE